MDILTSASGQALNSFGVLSPIGLVWIGVLIFIYMRFAVPQLVSVFMRGLNRRLANLEQLLHALIIGNGYDWQVREQKTRLASNVLLIGDPNYQPFHIYTFIMLFNYSIRYPDAHFLVMILATGIFIMMQYLMLLVLHSIISRIPDQMVSGTLTCRISSPRSNLKSVVLSPESPPPRHAVTRT